MNTHTVRTGACLGGLDSDGGLLPCVPGRAVGARVDRAREGGGGGRCVPPSVVRRLRQTGGAWSRVILCARLRGGFRRSGAVVPLGGWGPWGCWVRWNPVLGSRRRPPFPRAPLPWGSPPPPPRARGLAGRAQRSCARRLRIRSGGAGLGGLPVGLLSWWFPGARGGRSNGPYTNSLPLSSHFQGGGGGGGWVWGRVWGRLKGRGAPGPQHIWLKMTPSSQ